MVNPNATHADDSYGHGTLVAGILAGNSGYRPASDPLRGRYAGAAPDADLVSVKIADDAGNATVLDAINGIQFAVDHRSELGIRIINLSFEASEPSPTRPTRWTRPSSPPGSRASSSSPPPATAAPAPTPSATPRATTRTRSPSAPSTTRPRRRPGTTRSRRGPVTGTTQDGFAKPELYAPGAHIVANLAPGSAFATLCPSCIRDGSYIQAGGTSLAAPIVAGVAALILEKHPTWTPDMVKGALMSTGLELGRLRVDRAVNANPDADRSSSATRSTS